MVSCEYCKKEFSSKSSLNYHKKTTQYCLKIQKENGVENKQEYECQICLKTCSQKYFSTHFENNCGDDVYKLNSFIKELRSEINYFRQSEQKLKVMIKELTDINSNLVNENKELEKNIFSLNSINNLLKEDRECLKDIARQPKNITNNTSTNTTNSNSNNNNTNNTLNMITPLDFNDISKVKNTIDDKYDMDYMFLGQKGIAKFAYNHLLTDEEGNLNYICTDASRFGFKYKDESGEIRKDLEAKKLTSYLLKGGIKNKACGMASEWWTDDDGETNTGKFELLIDKAESMRLLEEDNTEFKKELAAMTSV